MRGLSEVSKKSQSIVQRDRETWVPVYYSIQKDSVSTTEGEDRYYVTDLIRPNSPEEIRETVERWKRM